MNTNSNDGICVVLCLVCAYCAFLSSSVLPNMNILFFKKKYGRVHRMTGLLLLLFLLGGLFVLVFEWSRLVFLQSLHYIFVYDISVGILGIGVAQSAAWEFSITHSKINNLASGVLDDATTVTISEMQEHVFYQIVNVIQIFSLHMMQRLEADSPIIISYLVVFVVSCPWLFRHWFPVNKFQDNYEKGQSKYTLISLMYRTKKYQYVFYKHFLLHGLNISQAFFPSTASSSTSIIQQLHFRIYWLVLNMSYVFEFFLQSLVKVGYLKQQRMLVMQQILMTAASIAAVHVLWYHVDIKVASLSLMLNFINRGHEVFNVGMATITWRVLAS